jgi:hypothetical protein
VCEPRRCGLQAHGWIGARHDTDRQVTSTLGPEALPLAVWWSVVPETPPVDQQDFRVSIPSKLQYEAAFAAAVEAGNAALWVTLTLWPIRTKKG